MTELREPGVQGYGVRVHGFRSLCHPQVLPLPCVTSHGLSLQLRQGPVGLGPKERAEPRIMEAQSGRLIEVERSVSGGPWWAWGGGVRGAVTWPFLTPSLLGRMRHWWLRRQLCRGSCSSWRGSWEACRGVPRSCCYRANGHRSTAVACRCVAAGYLVPHPTLPTYYCPLP